MSSFQIDDSFATIGDDIGLTAESRSVVPDRPFLRVVKREIRFGRISFGELRTRKAKAPDFVVDDWMVAREVSMFGGESEAGKTFLAIDVALRIALGWDVFGRRTKQGLVIYQIGESGDGLLDLRIPAWISHFGKDLPEKVPFEVLPSKINLWTSDDRAKDGTYELLSAIRGIMAEWPGVPLAAVFIDTFNKAMIGGNENDGKDVSKVISNAELIASETGAHVPIIHHFPKGGTTLRGHGSLRADVNSVALVSVDPQTKIRTIKLDKLKDGEKASMQFELMQVQLGERDDGKRITSCVVLPVGEKQAARAARDTGFRLSDSEAIFFKALLTAQDRYGIPRPTDLDCDSRVQKVVEYSEVKRIFAELCPRDDIGGDVNAEAKAKADEQHRGKIKARLKRARESLMHEKVNVIGVGKQTDGDKTVDLIWWTGRPVRDFAETQPSKQKEPELAPLPDDGGAWVNDF